MTRDGLPLDWPQGERDPINGHLYDRPSDISGNLDTKENLSPYHQAQAVFGVVTEPTPSLIWQFRALASEHTNPWSEAKQEVKSLLALARLLGGEEAKSGVGSALHRYTVLIDKGIIPDYEVPAFADWLNCYREAMQRYEVLEWERFVVCDDLEDPGGPHDLRTAGNYDKLIRDRETGEVMIGDFKSGAHDAEWIMKPTIQVALYSHSKHYSQQEGERTPIHPELNLDKGLLIHMPFNGGGTPECAVYPMDLEAGWRLAQRSMEITHARKMRALKRDAIVRVRKQGERKKRRPADSAAPAPAGEAGGQSVDG